MTSATPTAPDILVSAPLAPRRKQRVPLWDNARFLCVMLVVIGHATEPLTDNSDHAMMIYIFIYAFHMPAFAIISGYFSKASPPSSRQMLKVLTDIVLPYVIMQTIWTFVQWLVEGSTSPNPTTPHWTLWFLLALAIFRLMMPYLVLIRFPLLWAVLFSIGVGYLGNIDSTFSLSRAIGILPFFVFGWQVRQWGLVEVMHRLRRSIWALRAAALAVFALWAAAAIGFIGFWRSFDVHWLFYDDSYSDLGVTTWWSGLVRLAFLALAAVLSTAFLLLVPRRATWITSFGQATMYIYLLHSFILYPLRQSDVLKGAHPSDWMLLAVILMAIAISIVLASPFIRRVFRPLIEPKPRWLFIRLDDRPAGPSRTDPTGSRRS